MGRDQTINVCHIISGDLWAGAEVQMYTLITALTQTPQLRLSAIVLNEGKLARKLRETGIEVSVIAEAGHGFFDLVREAAAILQPQQIDILHSHRYKENIIAGLLKKRCGIWALVRTVHGMEEPHRGLKEIRSRVYAWLSNYMTGRRFDRVIAVSQAINDTLSPRFGKERMVTIHNFVNPETIQPARDALAVRREFGIGPDQPLIGSAGRMVPIKGYEVFLAMARRIIEKRPDARFILVGDGPELEPLKTLSGDMGLAEHVLFPGFRDDVIDLLGALDVFVISSHNEGVPMVLLEAMALGKAIVATAVGGVREILEDDRSGLLSPAGDDAALAISCLRVLEDSALKTSLQSEAARRLAAKFSSRSQGKKVMDLYLELATREETARQGFAQT